jgi:regulator of cell morphogenesis and NO signaling
MDARLTDDVTVGQLAVERPAARDVLERLGIDYCCGGERSLAEAAGERGLGPEEVLRAVREAERSAPAEGGEGRDWSQATPAELAGHIERRHHAFMRRQLPLLGELIPKVRAAHAEAHGEMLGEVERVFRELRAEIEMHLMKEEQVLFPYVRQLQAYREGRGARPIIHCITVQNPVRQMRIEHDDAGHALQRFRELTDDYSLPQDACPSFAALYEALQALERDLHEHIHLENNILFPRAVALEEEALA